jgi:hypothetical protein
VVGVKHPPPQTVPLFVKPPSSREPSGTAGNAAAVLTRVVLVFLRLFCVHSLENSEDKERERGGG